MITQITQTMAMAKEKFAVAQERMRKTENKSRREHNITVGDDVVVKTEFLHRGKFAHIPMKIQHRYIGPFPMLKQISLVAFRVGLP